MIVTLPIALSTPPDCAQLMRIGRRAQIHGSAISFYLPRLQRKTRPSGKPGARQNDGWCDRSTAMHHGPPLRDSRLALAGVSQKRDEQIVRETRASRNLKWRADLAPDSG